MTPPSANPGKSAPLKSGLSGPEMAGHVEKAAALLKAMAHPARLMVMCRLVDGESAVGQLHTGLDLSLSALSQHLAVLRELELVQTRRQAQTIYYSLSDGPALAIMHALHQAYCGGGSQR